MAKYAISFTALKPNGGGNITPVNGLNVVETQNVQEAKQALDKFALETCKLSDGFVGHIGSIQEIPAEEAPKKHWFKFG